MPAGFTRSEEGAKEYEKVQKEYENTLSDENYAAFLRKNTNSPHNARNKDTIRVMVRVLADDGNEYLTYDMNRLMYDPLGGEDEFYLPNIGKYPIPITRPKIELGQDMTTRTVVSGPILRYDVGYSIPFTKETVDKLHDQYCDDKSQRARTQYIVKKGEGGAKKSVVLYKDFRDESFEDIETGDYLLSQEKVTLDVSGKRKRTAEKQTGIP